MSNIMGTPKDIELLLIKEKDKDEYEISDGELSPLSPITYTKPPPSPRLKKNWLYDILDLISNIYK